MNLMDIACKNEDSDGQIEVFKKYNYSSYEQIYSTPENIVDFALKVKEETGQEHCVIPFCHTVEAEAMGGDINLGDINAGSRPGKLVYKTIEEIMQRNIEYNNNSRICKMLEACKILKQKGETVVYTLNGPFSILSSIIDTTVIFKNWRNNTDLVHELLNHISKELLSYAEKICDCKADYISYADPIATPKILGPKYIKDMTSSFTVGFLKELQNVCTGRTNITSCPITVATLKSLDIIDIKPQQITPQSGLLIPHCAKDKNVPNTIMVFK